ncbi:hypothetical protein CsatB_028285 [Cannabis sativa]
MVHTIEINVDGVIFDSERRYGFGFVVGDHDGCLLEAVADNRLETVQPELAEVFGVKEALS